MSLDEQKDVLTLNIIQPIIETVQFSKSRKSRQLLFWLSMLRTQGCLCGDVGSIPGLPQWVKDPVLPRAAQLRMLLKSGGVVPVV